MIKRKIMYFGDYIKIHNNWFELLSYFPRQEFLYIQNLSTGEKAILMTGRFKPIEISNGFEIFCDDHRKRNEIDEILLKEIKKGSVK